MTHYFGVFFPLSVTEIYYRALITLVIKHSSDLSVGLGDIELLFQVQTM